MLGVFSLILVSVHGYFLQRLVIDPALPEPWKTRGAFLLLALGGSIMANPMLDRALGPKVARVLAWPAYIWMGSTFYLLLALGVSDVVLLIAGAHGPDVQRTRALAVVGFVGLVALIGLWGALRPARYRSLELELPGWPRALDGYRMMQITDIHVGSLLQRRYVERLVARCNAREPDLLAITGDLVDGDVSHLREQTEPFAQLRARDGVYFVTGNHDYFSGAERWVARVRELGIRVLRNERVSITRDGASFELAGVDDYGSSRRRARPAHVAGAEAPLGFDLDAALAGWQSSTPLILLSHDPRSFELAAKHGVQLQLSGHTHDGQMWPFRYLVRLQTRYLAGIYRHGASALYVSRGTGFWGPPLRILAPAEITELTLRSAERG